MNTPPLDSLGQMIAKYQSNGHQPPPQTTQSPAASIQPSPQKKSRRTGFADKTLWDWLQLLGIIAIPIVVALLPLIYSYQQMQLQLDQQQEMTLQTAMDDLSDLLLHEGLQTSSPNAEVRVIARVKVLNAFSTLDPGRKRALLRFLYQAKLIGGMSAHMYYSAIVSLEGADLTDTELNGADLSWADLEGTDLEGANFSRVSLVGTNLSGADLMNAQVTKDQLAKTSSLQGATLPDGSIYPSKSYPTPNHKEP